VIFAVANTPNLAAGTESGGSAALALLVLIAALAAWLALRSLVRGLRARKTHNAVGGRYTDYVLQALVNAAKIDGRINAPEREAIGAALAEATGEAVDPPVVENAFTHARLSKDELIAYLTNRAPAFSHAQKVALLKALLSVFVADGHFDEVEHAALIDYTAAIGFERRSAPDMLRGLTRDFARGRIT